MLEGFDELAELVRFGGSLVSQASMIKAC
jgi:hypothetical protein